MRDTHTHHTISVLQTLYAFKVIVHTFTSTTLRVTPFVPIRVKMLSDLSAEHLQHQRGQLHAVFGLEREGSGTVWSALRSAAEVCQLLDHLSVEADAPWVIRTMYACRTSDILSCNASTRSWSCTPGRSMSTQHRQVRFLFAGIKSQSVKCLVHMVL